MRTNDQIDVEKQVELLARIAIGDRGALSVFYDQVGRPLHALCMKILGNAEEAEEAVQDTFLMIWKHAGNYDPEISRPLVGVSSLPDAYAGIGSARVAGISAKLRL